MAENTDSLSQSSQDSFNYLEEGLEEFDDPFLFAFSHEMKCHAGRFTVEMGYPDAADLWELGIAQADAEVPAQSNQPAQFDKGPFKETECIVCFTEVWSYTRNCCEQLICESCAAAYITQQINDGRVHFPCPALGCNKPVPRDEIIGRISDAGILDKYHRFVINANEDPNVKTCPNCCYATTQHDKSSDKCGHVMTCVECSFVWCFECHGPSHQGVKCKDNVNGVKALKHWRKTKANGQINARKCPKCKILIQRSGGCDHMKCFQCKTNFCYACGERQLRSRFIFGDHHQKLSVLGCPKNFLDGKKKHLRRFVRGSIFTGKLAATVVGSAVVIGLLPVAAVAAVFAGPTIGFVRLHKYLQRKKMESMIRTAEVRINLYQHSQTADTALEPIREFTALEMQELMRMLVERDLVMEEDTPIRSGLRTRRHTPPQAIADKDETTSL